MEKVVPLILKAALRDVCKRWVAIVGITILKRKTAACLLTRVIKLLMIRPHAHPGTKMPVILPRGRNLEKIA